MSVGDSGATAGLRPEQRYAGVVCDPQGKRCGKCEALLGDAIARERRWASPPGLSYAEYVDLECRNCGAVNHNARLAPAVAPVPGHSAWGEPLTAPLRYGPLRNGAWDRPSFGYAVLGFLIPVVGLVLYLVWRADTPRRAASAGKGALLAVVLGVALQLLATCAVRL